MKKIKVNLDDRSYDILIGQGVLSSLNINSTKAVIITNTTIAKLYQKKMAPLFNSKAKCEWIIIPDGEKYKTLATVEKIYHELIRLKSDRKTTLIALGGGVVGDITGFVAATFLRGVDFIQIPTTLLSQVDSSVGGKTGVDLKEGKNLIGAFYQPKAVYIDTDFLKTLPKRELLCGMAEVIKYGLLWDGFFFDYLEKNRNKILSLDHTAIEKIIAHSCSIKAEIVSKDEKESGLRSLLNLGHTVGHAIETLGGYSALLHGEAVSIGMVYAASLSEKRGLIQKEDVERIKNVLNQYGLPVQWPSYNKKKVEALLMNDKKVSNSVVTYVLLKKIGRAVLHPLKPSAISVFFK